MVSYPGGNSDVSPGTYFNCIMFMVASSVVTTIMILNYHHRKAHTHSMPDWVSWETQFQLYVDCSTSDPGDLPPVDPLAAQDVPSGGEIHSEDNPDAEQDEGD